MQRSSGFFGKDDLHRVRRLRWQVRAPSSADAFGLQRLLHQHAETLTLALDQALTRLADTAADPDQVWHLPQLTLRLDASSLAQLDADLPVLLGQALQQALQQAAPGGSPGGATGGPGVEAQATDQAPRLRTAAQAGQDALRHYLSSGNLPWTLAGLGAEAQQWRLQAAGAAALDALLGRDSASRGAALASVLAPASTLAGRIGALLRWLPLLTPDQRARWLAHSPAPAGVGAALARAWLALLGDPGTPPEWTALWLLWPTLSAAPAGSAAQGARGALAAPDAAAVSHWITGLPASSAHVELPALARPPGQPLPDRRLAGALLQALGGAPFAAAEPQARAAPGSAQTLKPARPVAEAQLVPLAGLVLLQPYLPRFLGGCGLLDSCGRAIPDAQLPRACAVLHALACGEAQALEHQLPLIKLLLGRSPDDALNASLPRPAGSDLAEIDSLLGAVRSHWKALGNTSAAGLRLSFLQRRGLLRRADGAWQLNLQSESFDMLLDLLPWSISLVKLPWMERPLLVEWRANAP